MARLLVAWRGGNAAALDRLLPLVHAELRRVAYRYIPDERPNHPLQTTALWLRRDLSAAQGLQAGTP